MLLAHSGQLEEAEKIFVDIYNQTDAKSKDREMLLLRAGVAHHIGNIYSDIDPSQAMPYLEEARDIFLEAAVAYSSGYFGCAQLRLLPSSHTGGRLR